MTNSSIPRVVQLTLTEGQLAVINTALLLGNTTMAGSILESVGALQMHRHNIQRAGNAQIDALYKTINKLSKTAFPDTFEVK